LGLAINDAGQVAGYRLDAQSHDAPFLWDPVTGVTDLAQWGWARAVNNASQVVGQLSVSLRACLWDPSNGLAILPIPDLGRSSDALGINDAGQMIGWINVGPGYQVAMWDTSGGMRLLGTLGHAGCVGTAINGESQVVGYGWAPDGSRELAFVWDDAGGMQALPALTAQGSSRAYAINDLGWIAGYSETSSGRRAVLWVPIPEPSSLLALLCGLGGMAGIIRYRRR
jgi:uncharacterized membrane protein